MLMFYLTPCLPLRQQRAGIDNQELSGKQASPV